MAPRLAEAWSNHAHGTSTSNNAMIQAQLLITEAGIATAEAYQIKITLELGHLKREKTGRVFLIRLEKIISYLVKNFK